MLEACLESHGVNVKELHPPPVDMSTELCYNTASSRGPMRMDSHMRRNSGEHNHLPWILRTRGCRDMSCWLCFANCSHLSMYPQLTRWCSCCKFWRCYTLPGG